MRSFSAIFFNHLIGILATTKKSLIFSSRDHSQIAAPLFWFQNPKNEFRLFFLRFFFSRHSAASFFYLERACFVKKNGFFNAPFFHTILSISYSRYTLATYKSLGTLTCVPASRCFFFNFKSCSRTVLRCTGSVHHFSKSIFLSKS